MWHRSLGSKSVSSCPSYNSLSSPMARWVYFHIKLQGSYATSEVVSKLIESNLKAFPPPLIVGIVKQTTFIWNVCRNQRRVEIEIRPVIPEGIRGKLGLMEEWSNSLILVISPDFKHTHAWDCEVCGMGDNLLSLSPQILNFVLTGKPSRETSVQVVSWIHLPQPKIVVYVSGGPFRVAFRLIFHLHPPTDPSPLRSREESVPYRHRRAGQVDWHDGWRSFLAAAVFT